MKTNGKTPRELVRDFKSHHWRQRPRHDRRPDQSRQLYSSRCSPLAFGYPNEGFTDHICEANENRSDNGEHEHIADR
jgi:hypothetical protein